MFGKSSSARTSAYPIRCVKETLPPRERARWLLMTTRLSASSLAGTARTLVAVGTVSDAFMFFTTLAAAPRSGERLGPDGASSAAGRLAAGLAGAAGACFEVRSAARFTTVASVRAATGVDRGAGSGAPGATAGLLGRVAEPSASAGAGLVAGAD